MRAQAGQPLALREGEGWMKQVLSDPSVPMSADNLKLLDRVRWTNQGLNTSLAELRSDVAKLSQASRPPPPGAPYRATINADRVFDGGDPQRTAFSLAARAGGYTDEEIGRAITDLQANNVKLFCKQTEGEPLILKREDATLVPVGGQDFIQYSMSGEASKTLLDARNAGPGVSVNDYRHRADNSLSGKLLGLGEQWLNAEQAKDKELGFDQNPILGPLVRGKYDAIREITQVVANGGELLEMGGTAFKKGIETGNLFYTLKDDAEQSRYFDAVADNSRAAFERTGRTYPQEEQSFAATFARGVVASTPKMAVSLVPGAALYYDALKHTNNDLNSFAGEAFADLVGAIGGPLAGRLSSAVEGVAVRALPSLVDSAVASRVVSEVVGRGSSGVVGAVSNVVTDMGPLAVQNALGNADPEEVKKRLTTEAFLRNVGTGFAMGVLDNAKHATEDQALLTKRDSRIDGPLYAVPQPSGETKYYAAVRAPSAGGKTHHEFMEVNTSNPKVRQKLASKEVSQSLQSEVDAAVVKSRMDHRVTPQELEVLKTKANAYAEKQTLLDAERGVLLSKEAPKKAEAPTSKTPPATAKVLEAPKAPTTKAPEAPTTKAPTTKAPETPTTKVPAPRKEDALKPGVSPEKLSEAEARVSKGMDDWRANDDTDVGDLAFHKELLGVVDDVGAAPSVRQKLETLEDFELRNLFTDKQANTPETLRVLSSKDPAMVSHLEKVLGDYGNGTIDNKAVLAEFKQLAEKGPPARESRPLTPLEQRLDTLVTGSTPPKGASAPSTPLPKGAVDLSTYQSDPASRAQTLKSMKESMGDKLMGELQEDVRKLKARNPEFAHIPDEDLVALRAYSGVNPKVGYTATNSALRTQNPAELARLAQTIQGASSALNQIPAFEGTVYRGVDNMPADVLAQYVPGKTITERAFTSTSKKESIAQDFAKDSKTIMVIRSRDKGHDMANASRSGAEAEVLFTPGTRFRVLAREKDALGRTLIYLDQQP